MDMNKLKHETLDELANTEAALRANIELLKALDAHPHHSGCYDLHDQITTFMSIVVDLQGVIARSKLIVPND
tara:strand:+ start:61 stop:276 length:216 start_codon:yes stop_codon:yes gene_type:complete